MPLSKILSDSLASGVGQGAYETALFHIQNEHASNVGGTISTTYSDFVFNTVKTNEISGASLSSNEITLPSGTYFADITLMLSYTNGYVTRLYNTTDSSLVLEGQLGYNHSAYTYSLGSQIKGRFTISAQKTFKIQGACHATGANLTTHGQGYMATSSHLNETTIWMNRMALFWKLA